MQLNWQNGRHAFFAPGFGKSDADGEDPFGDSRRIACKKCGGFHVWIHTRKQKSRARWCQVSPLSFFPFFFSL